MKKLKFILAFARELVDRGDEVEVITGFPNYPGGKLYPGSKIKSRSEIMVAGNKYLNHYKLRENNSLQRSILPPSFHPQLKSEWAR